MITLVEVKEFMNIDFPDNDVYLESLLRAAISRASAITGIVEGDITNYDLKNAIFEDVAFMYQNRGDGSQVNQASIAAYRRHCKRPMF